MGLFDEEGEVGHKSADPWGLEVDCLVLVGHLG
jgi:hypothetical protein